MQRLGDGPQGLFAVRGLDQDDAGGIETQSVEAVSAQAAMAARELGRQDEDGLLDPLLSWRRSGRTGWGNKTGQ